MITLVIVKNPFEPWNGRETKSIEAGITAKELLEQYKTDGTEIMVVVNAEEVQPDYIVKDEDFVVICPVVGKGGGKNIFALVLSIAFSVAAGAIIGSGWAAVGIKAGTFTAYATAAAVMFLGNALIGRMTAQAVDTGSYGGENNPTYSWGDIQTMQGQNNPIALTYGTVLSGGQSIGKYVNVLDNEEYLNWLIAAGEGPLEITDIKLNDNDISYYEGVVVETRSGTNTQEVISNFNDTFYTKSLDYQLTDTARTDTVPGNATQGIVTKIEFPRGLYYANDSGGLSEAWVKLRGDYRLGEDGEWIPFIYAKVTNSSYVKSVGSSAPVGNYLLQVIDRTIYDEQTETSTTTTTAKITYPNDTVYSKVIHYGVQFTLGDFTLLIPYDEDSEGGSVSPAPISQTITVSYDGVTITGSQSSAIRREFRLDGLTPGQYYVKMEITARSNSLTDSRASVGCYWTGLTSIIYDDFRYPNIALIGIKALATDQINGSPTLKFKKTRSKIYAWNPHANEYQEKNANNPAWACYDAVHLCRHMEHPGTHEWEYHVFGVKAERMLYDQFEEWAAFCEEKQLYVNIEINQLGEMLDVINQKMAPIGHGKVLRFGTRYGCTWDCIKQPVQMFGMGNIKAGTFQEQFLPTNDRANAVEITYMDADNDFNRETITIMADDYDTAAEEKTAQATFDGITSYEQAYREGKYQLYCNKYRLRTVSFEADIDAISCTIGDVVLVAHDVPKWAKSGRIHEVKGDELLLPVELSNPTKSYRLLYRTINDNMYTTACEILENKDGWCRVKIASFNAEDPPQRHDIFDLAETNIGSKPFMIQNISRAKSFSRKIECVEYDERVYSEDYDIPEIEYHEEDTRPKNVMNLSARAFHYLVGVHIDVSWERASNGTFTVSFYDGTNWHVIASDLRTNQLSADVDYDVTQVKVVTVLGVMATSGTVSSVEDINSIVSALTIQNLSARVVMSGDTGTVTATWDDVMASNFKNYVVAFRGSEYNTVNPSAEFGGVPRGEYTLSVKAKALDGSYGTETSITVSTEEIIDNTVAYSKTVPSSKTVAKLQNIGGKTISWNQLVDTGTTSVPTISGRKYYALIDGTASIITSDGSAISVADSSADMVVDLTLCFGSGNEPSTTSEFTEMFPNTHYNYAVNLVDASVDKIISKSGGTTIDTYSIPTGVKSLYGYGWSAGTALNHVDFVNKKFVQNVGKIVYDGTQDVAYSTFSLGKCRCGFVADNVKPFTDGSVVDPCIISTYLPASSNASTNSGGIGVHRRVTGASQIIVGLDPNLGITNVTDFKAYLADHPLTVYYELDVPVETDISAYIDGNTVSVEGGGNIAFHNSNNGYNLPVPSTVIFD